MAKSDRLLEARVETAERDLNLVRGRVLREIRDRKLYLAGHYATFEDYCAERWELDKSHASRLIDAATFAERAAKWPLPMPARESQILPLLRRLKSDDDRIAVWLDVLTAAGTDVAFGSAVARIIKARDVDNAMNRFLDRRS